MITHSERGEGSYGCKWIGENGFTSTVWYINKRDRDRAYNESKSKMGRKGNFTKDVKKLKR